MSRIALLLTVAAVGLLAGCGGGGKSKTSDTTKPAQTSTAGAQQARAPYLTAVHAYNTALRDFHRRFEADARAGNLGAIRSDNARFRGSVSTFDLAVRKISFPSSVRADVNAMLEASRALGRDLGGQARATPSELNRFTPRINQDIVDLSTASTNVSRGLGVA